MSYKYKFKGFSAYLGLNFLVSLLICSFFLLFAGRSPMELGFAVLALISNTLMLCVAVGVPALLLFLLGRGPVLPGALLGVFQLLLITDVGVYKIFKFHLNAMVLNLVLTPGGLDSLDQGWWMKAFYIFLAVSLLAVQRPFWLMAARISAKPWGCKAWLIAVALLFFVAADKGVIAWGMLYDEVAITKNASLFPLYQPLKIRTFANKYLGVKLDNEVRGGVAPADSGLDYPKALIEVKPPAKPLNFLIVVTDSLRYDMLKPDIMSETWKLAEKAAVFSEHYSGGNCTRFGIFSIFYGIHGNYWFRMLGERRGPLLIDTLKAQGYDLRLFAASKLSFPEFNKSCFVAVPREGIYDEPLGDHTGRDRDIAEKMIGYLKKRDHKKPYLGFVFYDASHGSYDYPPEFERFKPASPINPLLLNKDNYKPLFNRYKNSVVYDDHLTGLIIKAVRDTGGFQDTVIVVTGDHGEPFFESGYYGHNQGYCATEVRVPLVLYVPGRGHREYSKLTSHIDIVPTLMGLAGVKNPASDYSSGGDLFNGATRQWVSVFSWDTAAIIKDGKTLVMPLQAYRGGVKVYDENYLQMDKKAAKPFEPLILKFQKEASIFSR